VRRSTPAILGLALLLGAGVGSLHSQTAADSASVTGFYGRWFGAAGQGMARYASFYAPDGSIFPPNRPPVKGRDAIAAWFEQSRSSASYNVQPQGVSTEEMRFLSADWVVYRSTLRGLRTPKAGGNPVAFETKYVDLLHRTASGEWEVIFRMWSDNR